mmetsp:Transcript_4098/g.10148  ORF Transcript_4098/g.10148 Transcript_4098/m.10148 type:complete len:134 (+) Transcript_4098:487-888(+)
MAVEHARNREKYPTESVKEHATEKLMAQRQGNFVLGIEEISAQMTAHKCLNYDAEMTSHKCVKVNVKASIQLSKELEAEADNAVRQDARHDSDVESDSEEVDGIASRDSQPSSESELDLGLDKSSSSDSSRRR